MHKISKGRNLQDYLSEFVYGGIDGSVTTFAVVAGAAGANLESSVVIILGMANLIADGFSMSVGSYLSSKSERHHYDKYKRQEYWEVHFKPEEGRKEIREIYEAKGFEGEMLEQIVQKITSNKEIWVDTMMKEELEMTPSGKSPFSMALVTFFAFLLVGSVPLFIYLWDYWSKIGTDLFTTSCILTGLAFIGIGILKSHLTERSIWRGIVETLILGAIAASLAYLVGNILEKMFF